MSEKITEMLEHENEEKKQFYFYDFEEKIAMRSNFFIATNFPVIVFYLKVNSILEHKMLFYLNIVQKYI